jgi:hypothetical protein
MPYVNGLKGADGPPILAFALLDPGADILCWAVYGSTNASAE